MIEGTRKPGYFASPSEYLASWFLVSSLVAVVCERSVRLSAKNRITSNVRVIPSPQYFEFPQNNLAILFSNRFSYSLNVSNYILKR